MIKFRLSKKAASKLLAVLMALLLVAAYAPLVSVGAASATVIKSVDDLKKISSNLSGTYELGANIDCKGVSMSPIGNLAKPFTGKFTCPTGTNGKPTYAITNLTINVKIGGDRKSQQGQYKKNGDSNWCVGLFGVTKNATFQNIVILNANVSSDVLGGATVGSSYSENYNGMDEQGTGIMCGVAIGTKFTNCGVQGTVTSASNNVGGFVGQTAKTIKSSGNGNATLVSGGGTTVTNCYSYANVNVTGNFQWNAGGFVGSASNGNFTGSFFEGNLDVTTGTSMSAGGFVGAISSTRFTACYSTGSFMRGGYNPGAFGGQFKDHNAAADRCKQCYSNIKMGEGQSAVEANDKSGNFITPTSNGKQEGFAVKNVADINAKFASNDKWQTYNNGTLPTVKALTGKTVKTLAELDPPKPGSNNGGGNTGSGNGSNANSGSGDSQVTEEEAKTELIKEIRDAKDVAALTKLFKDLGIDVSEDVVKAVFDKAAEKGEDLSVDDLKAAGLTDDQLNAAVAALEEKMADEEDTSGSAGGSGTVTVKTDGKISSISTAEWILIIVLSALILLALAGSVVLIILLIKALKGIKGDAAATAVAAAPANEIPVTEDKPAM